MKVAVIHTAFEETPRTVALVDVPLSTVEAGITASLEYAYRRTQNIEGSWSKGPTIEWEGETHQNGDYSEDVTVMAELPTKDGKVYGLRSTSMMDQMLIGNKKYKVAFAGFEEIV